MTENAVIETLHEAKLVAIEDELAEFTFIGDGENYFFWPEEKLPDGIEIGDTVYVSIDYKNKEERILQIKKRRETEAKNAEMRKLLEELVN